MKNKTFILIKILNFKYVALAMCIFFLATSCDKEESIIDSPTKAKQERLAIEELNILPSVRNGRLHFETAEEAEFLINEVRESKEKYYPQAVLDIWEDH